MRFIAAAGKIEICAQSSNIELNAAKRVLINASEEIVLQAPKITIITQGAQTTYADGRITHQCIEALLVKSAKFQHLRAGDGTVDATSMPASVAQHNQKVRLVDLGTGKPIPNQRYRIETEDGQIFEGKTDEGGETETFTVATAFGRYTIVALSD